LGPVGRVRTLPSTGIIVVAVNIWSTRFAWDEETDSCSFVVDCILSVVIKLMASRGTDY
jgi:hypothetical protein